VIAQMGKGPKLVSKKQTCIRQLHAALDHLTSGDYECAITLAGAAEGQIAGRKTDDFWRIIKIVAAQGKRSLKETINELNQTRDWLKHPTRQLHDMRYIDEDEAILACLRASMQFISVFRQQSPKMEKFFKLAERKDFMEGPRRRFPPISDLF
jgi:hypothetical protein